MTPLRYERGVQHFYPRPPRGGRQPAHVRPRPDAGISIHALREEGDLHGLPQGRAQKISIHALREEGDLPGSVVPAARLDFYPRPPRGGRP